MWFVGHRVRDQSDERYDESRAVLKGGREWPGFREFGSGVKGNSPRRF